MSAETSAHKQTAAKQTTVKTPGKPVDVSLEQLIFDERNPRLPEEFTDRSQDNLLAYIVQEYHPLEIARSISAHGYFPSEPLIVVKSGYSYITVEGNRRLAALKLLDSPQKAGAFALTDADEWAEAAETAHIPDQIPCILAPSREQVAPIIGYRHISGIEPWDPWAKARFLATLIDDTKLSFDKAASDVGETARAVRDNYRNYRITKQSGQLGVDTSRVRASFGVFTRAMQDPNLREFIGAIPSASLKRGQGAFENAEKAKPRVKELISWVFGTPHEEPLFTDSRKLPELGRVVANKTALKELRATRNLEQAFSLAGGVRDRLLNRLSRAAGFLEAALQDFAEYADDDEVSAAVKRCRGVLGKLK